jgi:hypothetical protein
MGVVVRTSLTNKPADIQQLISGFRTVSIFPGPCIVRVHEAMDVSMSRTPHRYVLSVDLKFRERDALYSGTLGWYGCTKAEANREASRLAAKIATARRALDAAKEMALKWDTSTNRYTQKVQQEAFDKLIRNYSAEFVD